VKSVGFPPVAREDARTLILGSLPGAMSLQKQQYYAQPQNSFWKIMGALTGAAPDLPYEMRLEALKNHYIALWDACHAGVRPGSLDSAIVPGTVEVNDFAGFFLRHPHIARIGFNGAKAAEIYTRRVLPFLPEAVRALPLTRLPSTSPAHAGMTLATKLKQWREFLHG
jgi:hypoxanthine-DNA glycosylase